MKGCKDICCDACEVLGCRFTRDRTEPDYESAEQDFDPRVQSRYDKQWEKEPW